MLMYGNDYNSDRLIAFAACAAFMEIYNNNRKQYVKLKTNEKNNPNKTPPLKMKLGYRSSTAYLKIPFTRLR